MSIRSLVRSGFVALLVPVAPVAAQAPASMTTQAATSISQTGATLNATVNPNGSDTYVVFDYGTTVAYGTTTGAAALGSGMAPVSTNSAVSGLACGTLYHFRGRATNAGGATNGTDLTFTTSGCPPSVTTQAATSIGQTGATLNASVNPNGSDTDAVFDYGTAVAYGSTTVSAGLGSGVVPVTTDSAVSGLACGTLYHFRARATNAGGTTNGADLTFTTAACTPPSVTTEAATNVGQTGATLNATVNPNGSATSAFFNYGTMVTPYGNTTSGTSLGSGVAPVSTSKAVTGLTCGTLYHFRGRATNPGGTTSGADLTFTTSTCPPPPGPREYVSVDGNDANTCSDPATPCRTFMGAISQVTPGGEVVVLTSGTFGGGTITKSVTINAPAGVVAVVATAIIINASPTVVVTLRGLTFVSPTPGSGTAITSTGWGPGFNGEEGLNVENTVIHGWAYGIAFSSFGKLSVVDTTIRDNFGAGIFVGSAQQQFAFSQPVSIERTRLLGNGYGLYASQARATIKDSLIAGNGTGVYAQGIYGPGSVDIENCVLTHNSTGAWAYTGLGFGTIRVSNSTLTNNNVGIGALAGVTAAGLVLSDGTNTIAGNGIDIQTDSGTLGAYSAK